ncbi:MAG: hypothetical protein M3Y59_11070 [Myxococcota bacterium]|nr:hypothetical protein [Myxococcota bacterium]
MDIKDRDSGTARQARTGRDEEPVREQTPTRRVVRYDADLMADDDDILPRRIVGEEMLSRSVRDQVSSMRKERVPSESDVYNLSSDALRADPYGEDLTGIPPLEDEPENRDIMPDQIQEEAPGAQGDEDVELTARSQKQIRPILPDELPEG